MATNRKFRDGDVLTAAPTAAPNTTVESGDPVLVSALPGVALTDGDDTVANGGTCTVQTNGVFDLAVTAEDATAGGPAISAGEIVYYDAGAINVDATDGTRFGYALEDVVAGETSTIEVKVGY